MGLQSQLTDVSSDSIPILLIALIATAVTHLRSLVTSVGLSRHHQHHQIDDGGLAAAGLIALSHQLSLNDGSSFNYLLRDGAADEEEEEEQDGPGCVFCLCGLRNGDRVRQLPCRHVFHKECLDGWIDQMKFNCPLCRSPLVSEWRVDQDERRVAVM